MTSETPFHPEPGTLIASVAFRDAAAAIAFYVKAFGAVEAYRLSEPTGRVGHAEIRIGTTMIMVSDEYPDYGVAGVETVGGSPVRFSLFVADADAAVATALAAGATLVRPVRDQFYGFRAGAVADPFGLTWTLSSRTEDLTPDEIQRRWQAMQPQA
jgi:PhnB protein